ncbi:MAG: transcription antitermination factor NusB [Myxococcales bacterium]|nr:transcription antitermination factor NusB [Myxococcales bacterium]
MISGRRAAREAALVILFAMDAGRVHDVDEALRTFTAALAGDDEVLHLLYADDDSPFDAKRVARARRFLEPSGPESHWTFVERLVRGVSDHLRVIDDLIGKSSLNWKVPRMNRVDRNILRQAAYELAFEPEVPGRATLNEAIELAKRYGTEDSGKFVNGILDRIAQELERV